MIAFPISVKHLKTGQPACFECGAAWKLRYVTRAEPDELD
jgi:hypothetical protein